MMGIDLLDMTFRLEKQLGMRLTLRQIMLDGHTTVDEVVELLWRRMHGFEIKEVLVIQRQYWELDTLCRGPVKRSWSEWWRSGPKLDHRLEEMIPAQQRAEYWAELSRVMSISLPPLVELDAAAGPSFAEQVSTLRHLRRYLRAQLFERLEWDRIPESLGEKRQCHQMTRDELMLFVRHTVAEYSQIELEEIQPHAELVGDLGMD